MINVNYTPLVILMDKEELDFCIKESTENRFYRSKYLKVDYAVSYKTLDNPSNSEFYWVTMADPEANLNNIFSTLFNYIKNNL